MMVKRPGCGAGDCIHNVLFRCEKGPINTDNTTKCLDYYFSTLNNHEKKHLNDSTNDNYDLHKSLSGL